MHHETTLEAAAGAIPRVEAEVEAGVAAGFIVRVSLRVDYQGPIAGIHLGGG